MSMKNNFVCINGNPGTFSKYKIYIKKIDKRVNFFSQVRIFHPDKN